MTKMSAEQQAKQRFVERKLGPMLMAATGGFVTGCSYSTWGANEEVLVTAAGKLFAVNVTCDSQWAIAKDVMRAVGTRFE